MDTPAYMPAAPSRILTQVRSTPFYTWIFIAVVFILAGFIAYKLYYDPPKWTS
jgi:hypothetical protein